MSKFIIKPWNSNEYWDVLFVLVEYSPESLARLRQAASQCQAALSQLPDGLAARAIQVWEVPVGCTAYKGVVSDLPETLQSDFDSAEDEVMFPLPPDFDVGDHFEVVRTDCHQIAYHSDGEIHLRLCNKYSAGHIGFAFPPELLA